MYSSAVNLGYFKDDYVKFFTRRTNERRPPIINRGNFNFLYNI